MSPCAWSPLPERASWTNRKSILSRTRTHCPCRLHYHQPPRNQLPARAARTQNEQNETKEKTHHRLLPKVHPRPPPGKNEAFEPDRQHRRPPRKPPGGGGGNGCCAMERAHSSRDMNCLLVSPDDMMEGALVAGDNPGNKRWALRRKYEQSHVCLVGSQLVRPLTPKHRQSFFLHSFLAIELLQSRP